ncbi:MAG: hypothetical protein ABIJ96_05865 [Elusimicrobiota bacterium]
MDEPPVQIKYYSSSLAERGLMIMLIDRFLAWAPEHLRKIQRLLHSGERKEALAIAGLFLDLAGLLYASRIEVLLVILRHRINQDVEGDPLETCARIRRELLVLRRFRDSIQSRGPRELSGGA